MRKAGICFSPIPTTWRDCISGLVCIRAGFKPAEKQVQSGARIPIQEGIAAMKFLAATPCQPRASHCFRAFDAEPAQDFNQLAQRYSRRGEQKRPARRVFLGEYVVPMVEVVELLRQLEGVPRQVRRF
jgi:hypothetical protein